ncbi:alcohol dehydrogenase catalytic domain-containing protein [Streptomyces ossamyceticus]
MRTAEDGRASVKEPGMLAVVTQGNGTVEVTDAPKPTVVEPDDVIVKVTAAAVCGTDLHFVRHPFLPPTLTLGHEFIGTVVETGPQVHQVSEGQRVLSKMFVACGRCKPCRTANQPRCAEYRLFGGGILDGGPGRIRPRPARRLHTQRTRRLRVRPGRARSHRHPPHRLGGARQDRLPERCDRGRRRLRPGRPPHRATGPRLRRGRRLPHGPGPASPEAGGEARRGAGARR